MPNGYTFPVAEGKITEFPAFAMSCARAFLVTMRDEPNDAPIPDEITPSSYHEERIADLQASLGEIQSMTDVEAAQNEFARATRARNTYLAEKRIEALRLNDMLAKVHAWMPPTADHVGMKNFMIEQLMISTRGNYDPSISLRIIDWRKQEIDRLEKEIVYHRKRHAEEIERCANLTQWLKDLRASLIAPANTSEVA